MAIILLPLSMRQGRAPPRSPHIPTQMKVCEQLNKNMSSEYKLSSFSVPVIVYLLLIYRVNESEIVTDVSV